MAISAETVKELRNRTQAGFMECKKALEEAQGDIEKAITLIRKRGAALANKRAQRTAKEGMIGIAQATTPQGSCVALFELNAETDFVAKNEMFQKAVTTIQKVLSRFLATQPSKGVTLTQAREIKIEEKDTSEKTWQKLTILDLTQQLAGVIGEKIDLSRVTSLSAKSGEHIITYAHAGNKVVSAVHISAGSAQTEPLQAIGKDLAMQVVASSPQYLAEADVPATELEKEKEVYLSQVMTSGKPKEIAEKIVLGKLKNFYQQACLTQQPFIKDPKINVSQYVEQSAKTVGQKIQLLGFVRLACGEST